MSTFGGGNGTRKWVLTLGGKGSGRKPIHWEARIFYDKEIKELAIVCPELFPHVIVADRGEDGELGEHAIFKELEKRSHNFYYGVKMVVIRRHDGA